METELVESYPGRCGPDADARAILEGVEIEARARAILEGVAIEALGELSSKM